GRRDRPQPASKKAELAGGRKSLEGLAWRRVSAPAGRVKDPPLHEPTRFPGRHRLSLKGRKQNLPSFDAVPEESEGSRGWDMYTGTVIDELTAVVERAETRADEREREDRLAYWYAVAQQELAQADSSLAGVA